MQIEELLGKKVVFITGKGGVGKSTISSVVAYHLAQQGKRVLIIDADPAHSLPDSFGITEKVYDGSQNFISKNKLFRVYNSLNLDLLVLNPIERREQYLGSHRVLWLAELGKELGFYSNLARMSEFFTLSDTLYRTFQKYDMFVIDNEPSAGTLDMIENIDGWLNGLDRVDKYKMIFKFMLENKTIERELATEVKKLLFDSNNTFIENFKQMLRSVRGLFMDKKRFQPIIISSPEDAVIRETYRLKQELEDRLFITVDNVVFNKVSNDEKVVEQQRGKIKEFKEKSKTNCFTVPYLNPNEVNLQDEDSAMQVINFIRETLLRIP